MIKNIGLVMGMLGVAAMTTVHAEMIEFDPNSITIDGELNGFTVELTNKELEPGLDVVTIKLSREEAAPPPKFSLEWLFPSIEVHKYWNPSYKVDRVNYYYNTVKSRSTSLAPMISFLDINDYNRFCFSLGDGLNQVSMWSSLIEEDACFHCGVELFSEDYPAITEYTTELRFDRRGQKFYKTLAEVTEWWAAQKNYKPAPVPEVALRPMYSTWYSYHQSLDVDQIVAECAEAKKIGMEAVIVDDGWQTMDSERGYAYTGDWKPERIPDMKGFVQRIHALDMKFLLWYSVPFVGQNAENFERFKGKYLYEWGSQGAWVLDPRYPEVREFIIKTYEDAMDDWDLDGFKLDFMGFFKAKGDTKHTAEDGRDYASVNDAVDVLMSDILTRLHKRNEEIMIEFRQPYIGPLMRKYGNLLRASDCPNMAVINKVRVTDIRLLGGDAAVHADMLMWHGDDTVENAALQILNIIFSVPQISVRLNEVPAEHKNMIRFWVDYWNANRDVLIRGDFAPSEPDALYPVITSSKAGKTISAIYNKSYVELEPGENSKAIDIINARNNNDVVLISKANLGRYSFKTFDCLGNEVGHGEVELNNGGKFFDVPPSGLLQLVKID